MKIKNITVENIKAVSRQSLDLNGCSVIITGANNEGKSTVINGLIKRFQGEIPTKIVKQGEEKGKYTMELTDGSIICWMSNGKTENFSFTTSDGLVMKQGVLSAISEKYFGKPFDIEKFINGGQQVQIKELQKICGIDLSDLDIEYQKAYSERTIANALKKSAIGKQKKEPVKVEYIDVTEISNKIENIKRDFKSECDQVDIRNQIAQSNINAQYEKKCKEIDLRNSEEKQRVKDHNEKAEKQRKRYELAIESRDKLKFVGFESNELEVFVSSLNKEDVVEYNPVQYPQNEEIRREMYPEFADISELEKELKEANEQKVLSRLYVQEKEAYDAWIEECNQADLKAQQANASVEDIFASKKKAIEESNMPEGFAITDQGVEYNGFILSNSTVSSSTKVIAAMKLCRLYLGLLDVVSIEGSLIDNNNLSEVIKWADSEDIQLFVERVDIEGGEFKYNVIENV